MFINPPPTVIERQLPRVPEIALPDASLNSKFSHSYSNVTMTETSTSSQNSSASEDLDQVHILFNVPCSSNVVLTRERYISTSESEDSFIVFETSGDQEYENLDDSQTSSSSDEKEVELESGVEDLNSSLSVASASSTKVCFRRFVEFFFRE